MSVINRIRRKCKMRRGAIYRALVTCQIPMPRFIPPRLVCSFIRGTLSLQGVINRAPTAFVIHRIRRIRRTRRSLLIVSAIFGKMRRGAIYRALVTYQIPVPRFTPPRLVCSFIRGTLSLQGAINRAPTEMSIIYPCNIRIVFALPRFLRADCLKCL